jgi:hypothetical protein
MNFMGAHTEGDRRDASFFEELRQIQEKRTSAWRLAVRVGVAGVLLLLLPVPLTTPHWAAAKHVVLLFTLLLGFAVALVKMIGCLEIRCPRCKKRFFVKRMFYNFFAGACLNCGLKFPAPRGFPIA